MESTEKKRRPLIAAVLSLVVPGVGQLYSGQPRRALWFFAIPVLQAATAYLAPVMATSFMLMSGFLAAALALWVAVLIAAIDAYRQARRVISIKLRWFNRWYVYVVIFSAIVAISPPPMFIPEYTGFTDYEPFSIPSNSMAPTLRPGDYIMAKRANYQDVPPVRGDVVVYSLSDDDSINYVARVVGLAGDRIQLRGGLLYIKDIPMAREPSGDYSFDNADGAPITLQQYREILPGGRAHDILERVDNSPVDDTPAFTVPPGHLFVLGDNRDNSIDSRFPTVGFIPVGDVIGRVNYIWWSSDLDRIGLSVE